MRPLFQRCLRFYGARAREEQFRVDSSEVERTARLLCLGNIEERLLWVPAIGKSRSLSPFKVHTVTMVLLQSFIMSLMISFRSESWFLGQGLPLGGTSLGRREQQLVIALISTDSNIGKSRRVRGASGKVCLDIPPSLQPRGPQRGNSE